MYGERLNSRILRDLPNPDGVAVFPVPAGTKFECYWYVNGGHDGDQYVGDELLVLQQGRSGEFATDLLRRASHIDINDLRAPVNACPCRNCQLIGFGACDLHGDRFRIEVQVETVS